ncbi:DUF1254 domain-containing protein [Aureimonas jatrophae]|uniref:Uncharacterized membrane protein n=1 Tax=Aureimonas jatrophae TaxID=1166073 RepID=A0A1H0CP25_9HYPH|nr:DUF1254 domain-containing protein [Aureimonas jatrophae]MBB3949318.1 putative membrane protein [Aureimonas jatrophae]SDN59618.1 Uncharacterized membrane protein [Aureimonas jatrophae]
MGKLLLAVLIGLVGAAIVHIAVIFAIPGLAQNDSWNRLSRLGPLFATVQIATVPAQGADPAPGADFVFVDPAFIDVACRFDLSAAPVRVQASERTGFWSASIYARNGDNLYSISERVALEGRLDLLVGTREQLDLARVEGTEDDDTAIPVEFPAAEGYVTVRALVRAESERPFVDRFARSVACRPASPEESGQIATTSP